MMQVPPELAREAQDDFENFLENLAPARKRPHYEVSGIMEAIEPILFNCRKKFSNMAPSRRSLKNQG